MLIEGVEEGVFPTPPPSSPDEDGLKGGDGRRRYETPSMRNGMSTTVPQSMVQHDLNCSHEPTRTRPVPILESLEMKCCRINVLLVTMQLCLGMIITGLAFYMQTLTGSLPPRECPYWAGIPLLLAGVVGIYFCATNFAAYSGSIKAFVIKVLCCTLSIACIFLCMVAAVFPGIHGTRIAKFIKCDSINSGTACECVQSLDPAERLFIYEEVYSCDVISTNVKDYLILQSALNAIASGVCLWFVTLLWQGRYQEFYSGLRFYSYSASVPPHP